MPLSTCCKPHDVRYKLIFFLFLSLIGSGFDEEVIEKSARNRCAKRTRNCHHYRFLFIDFYSIHIFPLGSLARSSYHCGTQPLGEPPSIPPHLPTLPHDRQPYDPAPVLVLVFVGGGGSGRRIGRGDELPAPKGPIEDPPLPPRFLSFLPGCGSGGETDEALHAVHALFWELVEGGGERGLVE